MEPFPKSCARVWPHTVSLARMGPVSSPLRLWCLKPPIAIIANCRHPESVVWIDRIAAGRRLQTSSRGISCWLWLGGSGCVCPLPPVFDACPWPYVLPSPLDPVLVSRPGCPASHPSPPALRFRHPAPSLQFPSPSLVVLFPFRRSSLRNYSACGNVAVPMGRAARYYGRIQSKPPHTAHPACESVAHRKDGHERHRMATRQAIPRDRL